MSKPPKRPRDTNQLAKLITDIATAESEVGQPVPSLSHAERGKLEGQKGGRARRNLRLPSVANLPAGPLILVGIGKFERKLKRVPFAGQHLINHV